MIDMYFFNMKIVVTQFANYFCNLESFKIFYRNNKINLLFKMALHE